MGMNIQKSAGVKADTFILKRNNMDRRIRMDVAMLIILAICTRLVAGIMNMEKIGGLMYIEVAPDNPVYESRDGMLYNKEGELISRPNGR